MLEVVAVVGVAAVDHDVAGLECVGQPFDHRLGDRARRHHHPHDPRRGHLLGQFGHRVHPGRPFLTGQRLDGGRVVVVHDALMSARDHAARRCSSPSGPGRSFPAASCSGLLTVPSSSEATALANCGDRAAATARPRVPMTRVRTAGFRRAYRAATGRSATSLRCCLPARKADGLRSMRRAGAAHTAPPVHRGPPANEESR